MLFDTTYKKPVVLVNLLNMEYYATHAKTTTVDGNLHTFNTSPSFELEKILYITFICKKSMIILNTINNTVANTSHVVIR